MASLLFTIGGAVVDVLAFSSTNFAKERIKRDLAEEELQRARDKWNEDQMKQLDFVNKRLHETKEARTYINNVDEAVFEHYREFAKTIKPSPPETQLSYFYHPSETQKNDELLFLQLVWVLQHMPCVINLKIYEERYIKPTMSLIAFEPAVNQEESCIKLHLYRKKISNHGYQDKPFDKLIYHLQKKYIILIVM